MASNTDAAAEAALLKERRFKLSRACDRCRRRRIKCDEGHPCQACLTASSPCTFEEAGKRTSSHKSKRTTTLEDRLHHLETLINAIPPAVFAANGIDPGIASSSSKGPSTYPPQAILPPAQPYRLTNPSTHFGITPQVATHQSPGSTLQDLMSPHNFGRQNIDAVLAERTSRVSLSASYLYFDEEGVTRWQGETSGLPLLDRLVEKQTDSLASAPAPPPTLTATTEPIHQERYGTPDPAWFPDRTPRKKDVNPEILWRLITSYIAPDLMDSLVQCYLSTSYYILPFLHVPTFLSDYGNPVKWGEPGFGAFIVAICCLASRHMDDVRVRADPSNGISAGTQWFELFNRLRTLPLADRPTLYHIQADLIAAVYAVGLGKLSPAAALLSEAVTVCIDAGLHRSAAHYHDVFDPVEDEVRTRTFWCVYLWDKQLAAHFGRPAMIRLRDCDLREPALVDDDYITRTGRGAQPSAIPCRLGAFVSSIRMATVLESVVDLPPERDLSLDENPFLARAANLHAHSSINGNDHLREEEALLDDIHHAIPSHWAHTPDTLGSGDVIRVTQAERLHCFEHLVRMMIWRNRFAARVAERAEDAVDVGEKEAEAMMAAQKCALEIIGTYVNIAAKGLMTYYGVHVIHQLTQSGRTLMAVLLNCKTASLRPLIQPSLDALHSCVGLLKRFSNRYVCGLRSGDLLEEFCRITEIPLRPSAGTPDDAMLKSTRPPWIRPLRRKTPASARRSSSQGGSSSHTASPEDSSSPQYNGNAPTPAADGSSATTAAAFNAHSDGTTPAPAGASLNNQNGIPTANMNGSGTGQDGFALNQEFYVSPEDMIQFFGDASTDVGNVTAWLSNSVDMMGLPDQQQQQPQPHQQRPQSQSRLQPLFKEEQSMQGVLSPISLT